MCKANAKQSDKKDCQDRLSLQRPKMWMAFKGEAPDDNEPQSEQQLPRRVDQRFDCYFRPLYVDGCNRPCQCAAERIKNKWRKSGGEQWPQQNRNADDAQAERKPANRVETFAEHEPAEDDRPYRHRISDDNGARSGSAELRETGKELESRDIQKSRNHDMNVLATRYLHVVAGDAGGQKQNCGANAGASNTQAPGRYLSQGKRGGDPVQPPRKCKQHDQQPCGRGAVCFRIRIWHYDGEFRPGLR